MLKKLGIIAFVYVGALVCALVFASTAKASAALTAPAKSENSELPIALFSQFKTFGDLAKWMQVYELATDTELRGIEATLKKNDLSFKSALAAGHFAPNRLSWDDIYLTRTVSGDWKTTGGRILVDHKETPVDGLFEQAMKTFEQKSAQRTPIDLLIDTADAMSMASARASAAAAWTWIVVTTRRGSSWIGAHGWSQSVGRVKCSPDGKYLVEAGWAQTDKSIHAQKLPDHPLDPSLVAEMVKKDRALFSKCSDQTAVAATSLFQSPGRNAAEKMKSDAAEFQFGMANALPDANGTKTRSVR